MGILDDLIPRPTAPPATRTLKRRAVTSSQTTTEEITITIAPDNTCGYISERLGASRACPLNDWCYFFPPVPAQSFTNGGVLCCGETSFQYHATCINSEEYFVSSKCDGGCEVDNYTLKCTDSASPYCNTVSWEGSTFDYWCNDLDISTAQSAALTYKGQTSRDFGTINERDYSSLLSQMTEAQTERSVNAEATGTATSQSAATETNKDSGSSGTPVGAIAGGTVGGAAALALIGVAVFFFLRRRKKSKASSSSNYQQAPGGDKTGWNQQQQQGGYYYDTNSPSTGYDGSLNGQYGYQQAGGYPAGHQQPAIHEAGGEAAGSIPQELPDSGPGEKKPVELA
ncbi:uncharacterized protein FFUJ_07861 [Fusarium fujikuroi IMI 58289]|uniref:Uncharacterized protein n=1 Tax=Gibberella fujikuroi (strain CBS 195.34 / IMI 58289 / NRRL A-6831) TaxID=1279085 RepID=S0E358_GIBF5|nr:uncharacterized protein FFUJ_07861 [Fusarium fujikuroi IMI 58289]KLP21405.1 uncharacterized protein LW94_13632 [Fusarium fujikuroi]CCT69294.1 uncharacterized protein FFUJ_07861 [Fusarium fujikuroi IMI 58289]SCO07329.1 uncharacterized protein FFM5_09061 [Fusarium fujikuroi]SCO44715.1 uncharacterized protein FFMR_07600 [Fusarium fujikuroi]